MKLKVIRNVARSRSSKPGHFSKTELIGAIHAQKGGYARFANTGGYGQSGCLRREGLFATAHHQGELS